jgi:exonuclease VII large subunit
MRCFKNILLRIRSVEENFAFNDEGFSQRLLANQHAIVSIEADFLREASRFFTSLDTHLVTMEADLLQEATRFLSSLSSRLTAVEEQFDHSATRFRRYLTSLQEELAAYPALIAREAQRRLVTIGKRIAECENILLACDPQLKLKQGFSIVTDKSGKVIKSSKNVDIGDMIAVQLYEGGLESKVEQVK